MGGGVGVSLEESVLMGILTECSTSDNGNGNENNGNGRRKDSKSGTGEDRKGKRE